MIRYQLKCENDHSFDGWFANSAAFDKQAAANLVTCPACGSTAVEKSLMAPNVTTSKKSSKAQVPALQDDGKRAAAQAEIMTAMRELRRKIEDSAEYVGPRFAEEARRMHYKETETKGIYGEASLSDAKELADEGIAFHPLPILPEDQN